MVKLNAPASAVMAATVVNAASLAAYNVDPKSVSTSGLSAGGFFAAQLGVTYSSIYQTGFGVFAGGPFDCARAQSYSSCINNNNPSITAPTNNMKSWSGNLIDSTGNLASRKIYLEVGSADLVVGPNPMNALKTQLANFDSSSNTKFVETSGQAHTFPTDFDGSGDNACGSSLSPYISNCNYDGAGAVLQWMYGSLSARNTGTLTGSTVSFDQTGSYGSAGMDTTGYLYVPKACQSGSTVCKLHVALHGCLQSYSQIGSKFIDNTGYNKWADTNNVIVLYPQAIVDNTIHTIAAGTVLSNPNACFDWVGWYGTNYDQHGGSQMTAINNMVAKIISNYKSGGGSGPTSSTTATTLSTSTTKSTTSSPSSTASCAPLYGQCVSGSSQSTAKIYVGQRRQMAPSDAYASAGAGKLKLKGVKDSKIDKKKKKKSSSKPKDADEATGREGERDGEFNDRSVMLRKLEDEDEAMSKEGAQSVRRREDGSRDEGGGDDEDEAGEVIKTEAERRYEEQRRRRLEERLKREGVKTHKERVEELNRYLSGLSEHHDMPRIGPG